MKNEILSVFIPTYNRAHLIGQTLNKFIAQVAKYKIQIVISDNNSTDNTYEIVQEYIHKYPYLKYSKNIENVGFDCNVVKMNNLVDTKYCWLFGDDDIINENAIENVLKIIELDYDLIVANASLYSVNLKEQIAYRHLSIDEDKIYEGQDITKAFLDLVWYTTFIGSLIVKKDLWDQIEYKKYLKTGFVHVGIVFEYLNLKSKVYFIANPLVSIRLGNSGWSKKSFEIWYDLWPKVLNNLPNFNNSLKKQIYTEIQDLTIKNIIVERANDSIRLSVFKKIILKNKKVSSSKKLIFFLIAIFPSSILRIMYTRFLEIKKPLGFEYKLYNLRNSASDQIYYL